MKTVHAIISGRVQGVWYRGWTVDTATQLNIAGWVRNRRDGTVEAMLSGDDNDVDQMIVLMHQGSPHAIVNSIVVTIASKPIENKTFKQLSTL